MHPEYGVQDWDDAPGAIDWVRLRKFLEDVKETGIIPEDHRSHDHLNEQKDVPVDKKLFEEWHDKFRRIADDATGKDKGEEIVWGLVDGFLLYWDDVRFKIHLLVFFFTDYLPLRMLSTSLTPVSSCAYPDPSSKGVGTNDMVITQQVSTHISFVYLSSLFLVLHPILLLFTHSTLKINSHN